MDCVFTCLILSYSNSQEAIRKTSDPEELKKLKAIMSAGVMPDSMNINDISNSKKNFTVEERDVLQVSWNYCFTLALFLREVF